MDTCETIKVKPWGTDQGEYVEINAEDFNEATHELFDEDDLEDGKLTVAEMKAKLTELGVEIPKGAKRSDLVALLSNNDTGDNE